MRGSIEGRQLAIAPIAKEKRKRKRKENQCLLLDDTFLETFLRIVHVPLFHFFTSAHARNKGIDPANGWLSRWFEGGGHGNGCYTKADNIHLIDDGLRNDRAGCIYITFFCYKEGGEYYTTIFIFHHRRGKRIYNPNQRTRSDCC